MTHALKTWSTCSLLWWFMNSRSFVTASSLILCLIGPPLLRSVHSKLQNQQEWLRLYDNNIHNRYLILPFNGRRCQSVCFNKFNYGNIVEYWFLQKNISIKIYSMIKPTWNAKYLKTDVTQKVRRTVSVGSLWSNSIFYDIQTIIYCCQYP